MPSIIIVLMTAEDKKTVFDVLATSQAYINEVPKQVIPDFTDDIIHAQTNEISQTSDALKQPSDSCSTKSSCSTTSLENIATKIATCERCKLSNTRNFTVPGNGVAHPLVMIIGEGPGHDEDLSGQPFVGRAGQLLDKMMAAIHLSKKTNVFISNVVKCRPPHNRNPEQEETEACRSWLDAQIVLLQPKAILALGKVASHNLLGLTDTMSKMHGNFYEYRGIPVMPTYHPSALLRNQEMKRPAWEDLKLFRAMLQKKAPGYTEKEYYKHPENIPQMAYTSDSIFNQFKSQSPNYNEHSHNNIEKN